MELRIGCSGFPVAKEEYYKNFKVVEIQATFYQPPEVKTIEKWRQSAPPDFEFTLKAWQLITHEPQSPTYRRLKVEIKDSAKRRYGFFKPTEEVFEAWDKMDAIAGLLKAKTIVFQCPASFRPERQNMDNMKRFFKKIKRRGYKFVWEPRGDWPESEVKRLCRDLDLVHCVDPFKKNALYGDIRYFRLHGITGYRYKYTDADLRRLECLCEDETRILKKDSPIYVMFNNVYMFQDAEVFKHLVKLI